ncbi:G-protein coupled receptor 68-like [Halichoeres trimaculatus]|uniref:G-protein coupled receptor 68-like n=1 Tax=Halichoeres trimaculatus TaxID=147232 RepID=UPI003D9E0839
MEQNSNVRKDHVALIYVINLLITDLFQLCCLIAIESKPEDFGFLRIAYRIYFCLLLISAGFMVCVSLERYLVIAHPLWYRFRRTIKISVAVCVVVWVIPSVLFITVLPSVSVSSDEKRQIVGILVLVLLIYTFMFLPAIIFPIINEFISYENFHSLAILFARLSPLADLSL